MDAISSGTLCCSAIALERSSVGGIPYVQFEALGARLPSLMRQTGRILQITKNSAPGRVAAFLLSQSERVRERGLLAQEYHLNVSGVEIGSYLGLADETGSRLFTGSQEGGLLAVERKRLRLINIPGLQLVARGLTEPTSSKICIGNGIYSKTNTFQDALSREGQTGFLSWEPIYPHWRRRHRSAASQAV